MTKRKNSEEGAAFAALGLRPELLAVLAALGYEEPTPIQREAIPPLLQGRDLLGQAATGTGKTAAFALPFLQRLAEARNGGPAVLVLVPTRELAVQVAEAVHRYGRRLSVNVLPIYGGQAIVTQLRALKRGVDVVIATPGRALDHLRRGTLSLTHVRVLVLDEADEMLDMGFAEDLDAILAEAPAARQTVLFSATLPARIDHIARRYLNNPVRIRIAPDDSARGNVPLVRQTAYIVSRAHKLSALGRVLDVEAPAAALVFCRTRTEVDQLTEALSSRGYRAEALHGGMSQQQRDRVMNRVRSGAAELLIATDVAARGLDIQQLTHVINYDVPPDPESYVHRIGRVGRAGREGVAITLAEPREHRLLKQIERVAQGRIEIARIPTVADLRTRKLELTRAAVREAILEDDLEQYRVVVETLADEFDVMDVALAAVKLAHRIDGAASEEEIPEARPIVESERQPAGRGRARSAKKRPTGSGQARLWIGAGRNAGIRTQDIVGAIANEAGLTSGEIGAVEIADRFTLVELPESQATDVIAALRAARIKGRKVQVRRDRE
jgi:ATP-dependent RNA helicase DeaD